MTAYTDNEFYELRTAVLESGGESDYEKYIHLETFLYGHRDGDETQTPNEPLSSHISELDAYRIRRCVRELMPYNSAARELASPLLESLGFAAPAVRPKTRSATS